MHSETLSMRLMVFFRVIEMWRADTGSGERSDGFNCYRKSWIRLMFVNVSLAFSLSLCALSTSDIFKPYVCVFGCWFFFVFSSHFANKSLSSFYMNIFVLRFVQLPGQVNKSSYVNWNVLIIIFFSIVPKIVKWCYVSKWHSFGDCFFHLFVRCSATTFGRWAKEENQKQKNANYLICIFALNLSPISEYICLSDCARSFVCSLICRCTPSFLFSLWRCFFFFIWI